MNVIHREADFTGHASVVALGMFDGVHIGHQSLIRTAVRAAREAGIDSIVCTFDCHPMEVICPERAPRRLLTLSENLDKFRLLGADWALVKAFTPEFAAMPAADYLKALVTSLRVKCIVAGIDYSFGAMGRGNAALLRQMEGPLGYRAIIVPQVMDADVVCSSTYIRSLLDSGQTEHAEALLRIDSPTA